MSITYTFPCNRALDGVTGLYHQFLLADGAVVGQPDIDFLMANSLVLGYASAPTVLAAVIRKSHSGIEVVMP